jgi:hypothetical protein
MARWAYCCRRARLILANFGTSRRSISCRTIVSKHRPFRSIRPGGPLAGRL